MKIKDTLAKFYRKIKLAIYKNMFRKSDKKEEEISSSEYFCLQCIYLMDKPTISQFANFLEISAPNATYKVKQLIKKGYITKEKSKKDKREFVIVPTQKFFDYIKDREDSLTINDMKNGMSEHEQAKLDAIMKILNENNA